jgi:hypothetical protein
MNADLSAGARGPHLLTRHFFQNLANVATQYPTMQQRRVETKINSGQRDDDKDNAPFVRFDLTRQGARHVLQQQAGNQQIWFGYDDSNKNGVFDPKEPHFFRAQLREKTAAGPVLTLIHYRFDPKDPKHNKNDVEISKPGGRVYFGDTIASGSVASNTQLTPEQIANFQEALAQATAARPVQYDKPDKAMIGNGKAPLGPLALNFYRQAQPINEADKTRFPLSAEGWEQMKQRIPTDDTSRTERFKNVMYFIMDSLPKVAPTPNNPDGNQAQRFEQAIRIIDTQLIPWLKEHSPIAETGSGNYSSQYNRIFARLSSATGFSPELQGNGQVDAAEIEAAHEILTKYYKYLDRTSK